MKECAPEKRGKVLSLELQTMMIRTPIGAFKPTDSIDDCLLPHALDFRSRYAECDGICVKSDCLSSIPESLVDCRPSAAEWVEYQVAGLRPLPNMPSRETRWEHGVVRANRLQGRLGHLRSSKLPLHHSRCGSKSTAT